ncbi:ABC transporter permease [Streptomyces sp. NPDC058001]|uniref:ABC transporter permease n=1 Tax=Streptomyces sp. NPDC058001 TaxID=3346300 RepID=UPI0036E84B54
MTTPPGTPSPPVPSPPPVTPYRSQLPPSHDGFPQLLHAEWTKLRTVRRWGVALLAAVLVTVFVSMLGALSGSSKVAGGGPPPPPIGPDGKAVLDSFPFVHQGLTGDGTLTARVSPPTGREGPAEPWAKAGIMVKASTKPGSAYAAVMVTPGHGVRLQSDFTHDTAGAAETGDGPYWLRLTRAGDVVTAYESADGARWNKVGSVTLKGLPRTARAGLFAATPGHVEVQREFGSARIGGSPSQVTAAFDRVTVEGTGAGSGWRQDRIGGGAPGDPRDTGRADGSTESGGTWRLTASGDIAPMVLDTDLVQRALSGAQIGLIPLAALGALFITAEYRRGMIRATLTASPRRGRVLAAKAVVLAGAAFVTGAVGSAVAFLFAEPALRERLPHPLYHPDLGLTDGPVLRAVLGTAVLLAAVTVLALAAGALLRNTAAAVTLIVVVLVLPLVLLSGLPVDVAQWVMRLTPLAGFAIQRTALRYEQVDTVCLPEDGCYPQGPWTGLTVLCGYAVVVLGVAMWRLRKRDA